MITRIRALAGSIVIKVACMLLLVGGTTIAAIWTSFTLFGEFSTSLGRFQDETVPHLKQSSQIIERAGDLGEGLSALLIAGSSDEMSGSFRSAEEALAALEVSAEQLSGETAQAIIAGIRLVSTHLEAVAEARRSDLVHDEATLQKSDALSAAVTSASDVLVSMAGDAFRGVLASGSSETVTDNRAKLEGVARAVELERRLGEVQSIVLTGASADDAQGVAAAQAATSQEMSEIATLAEPFLGNAEFSSALAEIHANTDAAEGILAARRTVIAARERADEAARLAAEEVRAITASARELGQTSMLEIETSSGRLEAAADGGLSSMTTIAIVSVIALLLATAATLLFIVRPLVAVTRVTERLAQRDLRPVTGFDRQQGEIGRMAAALTVFRDGMIEQQRLQQEEREREEAERERVAREERDAREREEAQRAREAREEAEKREREMKELQAREAMRAEAEAQRKAHAEEQERVVSALALGMRKLADGNLAVRLDEAFPEAYEALRSDFNEAVTSLSDLIGQIAESAGRIDDSAAEISSASNELSRRTESSAATLEETAAALNELTSSVASAAEGAGHAKRVADMANSKAETSRKVVGEAISAMAEIEDSSKKISNIISVIDDIAFQTNLLALNAGVEAARAGEAGRGFAVVASEVRALAQRSSEAAREINSLISTSNGQVERGAKLVDDAGAALQEIIADVGEITQNVSEIAISAREQASGVDEINTATGLLDGTMQQNAAMTEETTAASQVLMNESRRLREMVQRFNVAVDRLHELEQRRVA